MSSPSAAAAAASATSPRSSHSASRVNPFVNPETGVLYGLEEGEDQSVDDEVDNLSPLDRPLTLEGVTLLTQDEEGPLDTVEGVNTSPPVASTTATRHASMEGEKTWSFAALPPAAGNEAAEGVVAGAGSAGDVAAGIVLPPGPVAANDDDDDNEAILDGLVADFQERLARALVEPRHRLGGEKEEEGEGEEEEDDDNDNDDEEDADDGGWHAPDDYMSDGEEEEEGEDEGATPFVWEDLPATAAVERLRTGFEALAAVREEIDALDVAVAAAADNNDNDDNNNEGPRRQGPGRGTPAAVRARSGLLLAEEGLTAAFRMQLDTTDWLWGALEAAHQGREMEEGRTRALATQLGQARFDTVAAQAEAAQLRFELAAARRQLEDAGRDP